MRGGQCRAALLLFIPEARVMATVSARSRRSPRPVTCAEGPQAAAAARKASPRFPRSSGQQVPTATGAVDGTRELGVNTLTRDELAALPQGDVRLLDTDSAQGLLASTELARVAYVAADGTPRVFRCFSTGPGRRW